MLKKYMVLLAPDANTESTSSSDPDEKGADSSTAVTDATEETEAVATEETEESEASSTEETDETVESQEEETEEKEEKPPVLDKPEDTKLEFHKHPRFQELVTQKNEFQKRIQSLEPQAKRAEVLDSYCRDNGISEQHLASFLEYRRLLREDPAKAFEMLKGDYQALAAYSGEVLAPDLQAKVAAGTMDPADAKELMQARSRQQHQQWNSQTRGQTQQQQQVQAVDQTIGMWAEAKAAVDPDLKPGTPLWKYLDQAIKAERGSNSALSPAQVPQLVERLYKEAKEMFRSIAPKKTVVKKPLNGNNSSSTASAVCKTPEDVARFISRGGKPDAIKYGN